MHGTKRFELVLIGYESVLISDVWSAEGGREQEREGTRTFVFSGSVGILHHRRESQKWMRSGELR